LRLAEKEENTKVIPVKQLIHATNAPTILVVDDDKHVRSTTVEILQNLGYQTVEASDGQNALNKFTSHQKNINLIVTDMVMPKMGGDDLAAHVRKLDKLTPILFITGYDLLSYPAENALEIDYTMSLNKPFSPIILSNVIHDLLLHQTKKTLSLIQN